MHRTRRPKETILAVFIQIAIDRFCDPVGVEDKGVTGIEFDGIAWDLNFGQDAQRDARRLQPLLITICFNSSGGLCPPLA